MIYYPSICIPTTRCDYHLYHPYSFYRWTVRDWNTVTLPQQIVEFANLVPLKLLSKPYLLLAVGHGYTPNPYTHCILQCWERPYPEELSWVMILSLTCTCTCTCTTVPSKCLDQAALHLSVLPDSLHWVVCRCNCVMQMMQYMHSCSGVFILSKLWALLHLKETK